MKVDKFLQVCGGKDGYPSFALTGDGRLWLKKEAGEWEEYEFNKMYEGYYPYCRFNNIGYCESGFLAAGLSEDASPLLFRSLLGQVWEQVDLFGKSAVLGYIKATGRINKILYDDHSNQILLLCANGDIITLPNCPKCARIKKITEGGIIDGVIKQDTLYLTLENGDQIRIPMQEALQYRISLSYARQQLENGGYMIDLRSEVRRKAEGNLEGSLPVSTDDIDNWLTEKEKNTFLTFFCSYGINADEVAQKARSLGFSMAFSLGGIKPLFHVK